MFHLLQFQKNTEHANFSNSVVDVFTQLTQCFEVLQKLECQDPEIWKRYMKRFAKTVVKVLTTYADVLKMDFPNHVKDEATVSAFFTFLQHLKRSQRMISHLVPTNLQLKNFLKSHPSIGQLSFFVNSFEELNSKSPNEFFRQADFLAFIFMPRSLSFPTQMTFFIEV